MKKYPALKLVKEIFSRTFILYLIVGGLLYFFANIDRATTHTVTTVLSRYMPSYDYLIAFNRDRSRFDLKKMKEFERYYERVIQFMPFLPDAHSMLGFCYYYNGELIKASHAYQEAVRLNPKCFNFYYNLGIISLQQRDFAQAFEHFKNSVHVSSLENLRFVVSSRIYFPFLPFSRHSSDMASAMAIYNQDIYRRGFLHLLAVCAERKDYASMLSYAQQALSNSFTNADKAPFYYYAGLASYELKDYLKAIPYLQEALRLKFSYAQVYHTLGLCLQALHRQESAAPLVVAMKLFQEGKVFRPEEQNRDLLIY